MSLHPSRPLAALGHALRGALGVASLAGTLAMVVLFVLPPLAGFDRYLIEGGSMSPEMPRGSIAYERRVPVEDLRVGDVVTYVPPGAKRPLTHRIVELTRPDAGAPVLRTRGDANGSTDLEPIRLRADEQPRVAFSVPVIGWPLLAMRDPRIGRVAIGLIALLTLLPALASLWREGDGLARAGGGARSGTAS